jgi:hypothetical protein
MRVPSERWQTLAIEKALVPPPEGSTPTIAYCLCSSAETQRSKGTTAARFSSRKRSMSLEA